jgi:hypothetical protein
MALSAAPTTVGATLLLLAGLTAPVAATSTAAVPSGGTATIRVGGTWLAAGAEGAAEEQYAIAVADDLVPVSWSGGDRPEPGSRVTAELLLPDAVSSGVADGEARLRADTPRGDRALALVDARADTLVAAEVSTDQEPETQDAAPAPVSHRVYVAAPEDLGGFALPDSEMLAMVEDAAAFWEDEADGVITDMVVPGQVVRYPAVTATDDNNCGLDQDFFEVMEEAAAQFPQAAFHDGTDLLVVLAPSLCTDSSTSGRALLGQDLTSGGLQVASVDSRFAIGTLAHEWGHNFGLMHANLGRCDDLGCPGEYDNLYNVMGRGISVEENRLTALSTAYRSIAGVLAAGEVAEVPFPESGGATTSTFVLAPRSEESGQRAVRVVDPDDGDPVLVEYRSGTGQDALSTYAGGLTFRGIAFRPGVVLESVDGSSAWLRTDAGRAAMVDGESWSNGSGTLSVSVDAVTGAAATVTVVATPGATWPSGTTVAIEGEPAVGSWLTAVAGPSDASTRRVQWYADGVAVPGATDWSYAVRPQDEGAQVRVAVTDYDYGRRPRTTSSAPVEIVPGTLFAYDGPFVTGTPAVGETLTTDGAIWDDPQFAGPTSTSLQWRSGGVAVPGATGSGYVVRAEDVGRRISVADTGTREGYTPLTLVSAETAVVPAPEAPPFPFAPTPVVDGTAQVGRPLTVETGDWPAGTTLQRQWLAAGAVIAGATGTGYTPGAADVGRRISVRVTASHPSYRTTTRTSAATAEVRKGDLVAATPRVSGTPRVGRTLTVAPGTWTPAARLRLAWLADGRVVRGATGRRLVLRPAHRGARIAVRVTGSRAGYARLSVTSAATRAVRR